ncbi:peptidoglycan DD-metalloendopeptidase family protein [Vibrio sp. MA40-2]|uniref:peptidoglycan DD-metalloendopeptidase family protein n=1 Tax=Vibrio sp. MA40-2 TaxID=3391828 RepID=UPI0039A46E41
MSDFSHIFGNYYPKNQWINIDLAETNPDLDYDRTADPDYLSQFVQSHFTEQHHVAIGGYAEKRATYRNAAHFSQLPEQEIRCIHLGLDLWVKEGTAIHAPIEGIVHSFNFNDLPFDYGPTIILQHEINNQTCFCLYGHLSKDSLDNLKVGQVITKGQPFAYVGDASVNGGWSPHLHIQLIKDMFEWQGDFPGATSAKDQAVYLANSPDPSFFLGL